MTTRVPLREHPEDKATRLLSEAFATTPEARAIASEFATHDELLLLLSTYADAEAHDALGNLRERFWSDDRVYKATSP